MNAEERARLKALIDERRRVLADAPADGRAHGTETEYTHDRCRCDACRRAANAARNRRRQQFSVRVHGASGYSNGCRCDICRRAANAARNRRSKTPNVSVHGYSGYTSGCRCDICREGKRLYYREYRAKKRAAA